MEAPVTPGSVVSPPPDTSVNFTEYIDEVVRAQSHQIVALSTYINQLEQQVRVHLCFITRSVCLLFDGERKSHMMLLKPCQSFLGQNVKIL